MDQTFDLVGVNLVLQVPSLISTMATTKTSKHKTTNKCGSANVNSPQTRSMVAKLASPQTRSMVSKLAVIQQPVTDPVIGSTSVACGRGSATPDSDDSSVHVARAAPRVDRRSLLRDLSDDDYTDDDHSSVPENSLSSSVIMTRGAKKTQKGSAVAKKATKKTTRAKGKPPLPPREKNLDPKAASKTPPGQKAASTCGASFSKSEDIALCRAYVNSSQDLTRGTDIRMKDFWNQVFQGFETIMLADFAKEYIVRDAASLRMRFGKRISKVLFIWLGYMRRVRALRPSGVPEDEYHDMATAMYNEEESKPFPFAHCVKIIEECPIFTNMTEELVPPEHFPSNDCDEDVLVEINNTTAAMGSQLKRPMGQKAAKQKLAKEQVKERGRKDTMTNSSFFSSIADSNNNIAEELKERTNVMRSTMSMIWDQNRVTNLFQMIEMYRKIGNNTKADELMIEAERLIMIDQSGGEKNDKDDGGGKLSPEEAEKEAKNDSMELSEDAKRFCADVFNAVFPDMEKSFPSEPKYKDLSYEQKQFLRDLTPSCISDEPLDIEMVKENCVEACLGTTLKHSCKR